MIKRIYTQITAALLLFTACTANLPDDGSQTPEGKGEPVNIAFEMYSADLTKAAKAVATEAMQEGKTFRIYAYNSTAGSTPDFTQTPVASAIYTVKKQDAGTPNEKLVATGDMKLYRGTYYMYLVSYNEESSYPELSSSGGKINVTNGKDFMYTTLENIIVQPTAPGGNSMTVPLPSPFIRLGSQVVVRAAAKNGTQPVSINKLEVREIKVSGLPASLDYTLGKTTWETNADYAASYTYPGDGFKRYDVNGNPGSNTFDFWTSPAQVLLPVDGSSLLKFSVKLWVQYSSGTKEVTKEYPASIQKVLLPGMAYVFDFTLTFYGEIVPSDLTLAVKEYNTIPLDTDGMGK